MKMILAQRLFLLSFLVGFITACKDIASPTPAKTLDPANSTEIIVYTWDNPMMAAIPRIHIWKDGHAMWVTCGQDKLIHVYETILLQDEMSKVQEVLSTSGFWKKAQPEAQFTPASWHFVWANDGNQTGVVPAPKFDNTEVIDLLTEILESSTNKNEYFPPSGYLFVTGKGDKYTDESTYLWSEDTVQFEFEVAPHGVYVDGKVISTIWNAVQQGAFQIESKKGTYQYDLKIPGVSCVISFEPYMCNMYSAQSR